MKSVKISAILVLALVVCLGEVSEAGSMGTAWTYQGRLIDANSAADGLYDFEFRLYDEPIKGVQQGNTIEVNDLDVIDGYFTAELDFGSDVFNGKARWLHIGIRPGDSDERYTILSPRQEVTPTPYALYTENAGTDNDWMVSGNNMYSIPTGNIGIGTSIPSAKLDVDGAVNCSSFYEIGGERVLWASGSGSLSRNTLVGGGAGSVNTGTGVTLVGCNAGHNNQHNYNTFVGDRAGYSNIGGWHNTFIGTIAGYSNIDGIHNTFMGYGAGYSNKTAEGNTFVGYYAGYSNVDAAGNTFLGFKAGENSTRGRNTFLGTRAGIENTTGDDNTFVGYGAGYSNTEIIRNTFLGAMAGFGNTGTNNTFLGAQSGFSNTTGSGNTFVGRAAGWTNSEGSGNVFIGHHAGSHEIRSNKLYIANGASDPCVLIYGDFSTGNVGMGTTSPAAKLEVVGSSENPIISATNNGTGNGVYGTATGSNGVGVYGEATGGGKAGYFDGDVHTTGDITKAYTVGTIIRATPIAYAFIYADGTFASGTPNVSSSWNAASSRYEITISDENYIWTNYVTVATVTKGSAPRFATTNSVSGKLLVYVWDTAGSKIREAFQFVTYKP